MSSRPDNHNFTETEKLLEKAKQKELNGELDSAFQLYIQVGQSFLQLSRTATSIKSKNLCKEYAGKALERAKKLKAAKGEALRPVRDDVYSQYSQGSVVEESSSWNGIHFPPWPETDLIMGTSSLIAQPALSPLQNSLQASYRAPSSYHLSTDLAPDDILQNNVTDCSLISSLATCLNHQKRFGSKICNFLYPRNEDGSPRISENGVYALRVFCNGIYRQVTIDHTLPTTVSGKRVCAVVSADNSGTTQLLPALVEKAFMKLHGGYDFPGSNSGADLQTLIGWIPETIDLRSNQFARETTWSRFRAAYERGECLATLGTGKQPVDLLQRRCRLLASHSYPILDINSDRMVSILDSWEGAPPSTSLDGIVATVENLDLTAGNTNRILKFSWEEICEIFDTLYLSWNPAIWKHQTNLHRTWKPAKEMNGMPINHSMTLGIPGDDDVSRDEICVLLTRHLMDKTTHSPFVALHVGQAFGRIQSSGLDSRKQTYTDSSHVLRRVQPYSNRVSIVTSIDDCSSSVHYTLTVLSNTPVSFDETPDNYLYSTRLESAFTLSTAGGNIEHPTFMINPQWHLKFLADPSRSRSSTTEKPKIRITLEAGRELPLNACLAWSSGERITELVKGDIVADTGEYSYGLAAFAGEVKASDYTLIVSSFSPRDLGDFALTFESSSRFELEPIPQEGAGMFKKVIKGAWEGAKAAGSPRFGKYEQNPVIDLTVSATCQMKLRLRLIKPNPSAALNVTVFQSLDTGQGKEVLTSGPYSDAICGAATKATTLPKGKYVIIPSTFAAGIQERWELIVYHSKAEVKVTLRD